MEKMTEINISTYQDYLDAVWDKEHPEIDESLCQVCGEDLESHSENVGFDDNPMVEVWHECPNGCDQDSGVTIL